MSFRLFDVNVEIQAMFWVMTVLLGMNLLSHPWLLVIWVLVVLVSILVHEFGHAFAVKRHRIEPEISLHGMGGTTAWRPVLPVSRLAMIGISLAGPFAGFILGGLTYAVDHLLHKYVERLGPLSEFALDQMIWVNIGWGLVNLAPVLPFDGGHVLEQALGPKRARMTAGISFLVGMLITLFFLHGYLFRDLILPWGLSAWGRNWWGAFIFGSGAIRSFRVFQATEAAVPVVSTERRWSPPARESIPAELAALLRSAHHALTEEDVDRAIALAHQVLEGEESKGNVPPAAGREALEIIAWAHLLEGRLEAANDTLSRAKKLGEPDVALVGAVLLARRELGSARRVLEQARARGDDRKEVVGPLIQILIEQGEVPRAAAVALDIVDALSTEDARKMAQIALEHRAYAWSARLYEALFDRQREADDAYDTARALALDGNQERALEWLKKAVDAGFSDRARAWSDAALEALRAGSGLESVLPRP